MPSEVANRVARSRERCGVFCDATPEVEFTDEWGVTVRRCRECYERPCGCCGGAISDENKRKGLCDDCRREIRSWRDDGGRENEGDGPDGYQQATLVDVGGGAESGAASANPDKGASADGGSR